MSQSSSYEGIAVVGMAGRFPGADSVEELWANLLAGQESVSFFTDEELAESGLDGTALRARGHYIAARGVLKDADCFDAAFFGISPKEAEVMDPQQRLFLEVCWAALERAGYPPNQIRASVGVFAGATFNTYYLHALHQRQDLIELVGAEQVMFGNEKDYLTTRVAYKLGLKGPAVNVNTACSTSLVAVAQACQSLLTYQCDIALAGGSSVTVPQKRGYFHDDGNIGSSDGHTRTFDVQSSGTVFSNGVAAVVLKRLADAVDDGDQVYAVITAAALNNDGAHRVSFGAPGVEGQSEVIAMAHAMAGVDPSTITYVEAHGTATPLGDPIEVAALTKAFRLGTDAKQFCALGAVKTNLGHLDVAAGVTGLIKVALSLHHKVIPGTLHFTAPNPKLDLENSPFYVSASRLDWIPAPGTPRRAGISSFGTGGTNVHLVVEEAPALEPSSASRSHQLLTLSAKTADGLNAATANLARHLRESDASPGGDRADVRLADTAYTLQTGRSEFSHRRIVVCRDGPDGADALTSGDPKRVFTHQQQLKAPPVVFMFPGQGAQYPGMGASLYRSEPVFRREVDRCAELLQPILRTDLRTLLFPAEDMEQEAAEQLKQTRFTQPALFTIEYALATLWMSWGIKPAAMIGHSVGEYVAGCLAGVISLEDALTLVAHRGALVQAQPGGAMLAVRAPEKDVAPLLSGDLAMAAVNAPGLCVVAGPHAAVAALEQDLTARGVVAKRLHTSHAFHSPMMEPVLAPFARFMANVRLSEPRIPYVSNVTGRWTTPVEATSVDYWARHVRDTVRFSDGISELLKESNHVMLEVGPGQTLATLTRQHASGPSKQIVLASLFLEGDDELRGVLETLGRLWMAGCDVDWQAFYGAERRRRVVLPTYPFERKRFWPDAARTAEHPPAAVPAPAHTPALAVPEAPALSAASVASAAPALVPRGERLRSEVAAVLQDLSGYELAEQTSSDLLELGLDSLLLTQAATVFQRRFGVRISFRQLMEDLSSIDAIAAHLDANMPPEPAVVAVAAHPPARSTPVAAVPSGELPQHAVLEQLLQQQQQLTRQLLELMGKPGSFATPATAVEAVPVRKAVPVAAAPADGRSHGPFRPLDRGAQHVMSPVQSRALDALIARYVKRTTGSKQSAAANRRLLADPRSAAGFKQLWKEMVYPIVTTRSDGARVWDVDGNEYVDFVMGFGASLFGHRPPFVVEAVRAQLDRGFEIGPIQPLAGEVARLVQDFTGMERVGFTNTGSEAVLAATRVSRTVTGRDKIAVFAGAYHGIFDEVLFRPATRNGEPSAAPLAPGIPESALGQVVVLEYGDDASIEYLRAHGAEFAAVLVEPVQSRRLELQPREFLQELRRVTEATGTALIFDEIVMGFRLGPGGAQSYFGVKADLATYGKVIGGGLPIGVVTGSAKFMDALDGGAWNYGDTSFPEVGVTFFAGTFVRHPLALAAAHSVLTHLKEQGPQLQQRLNDRTARLADELRAIVNEIGAPYQLTQFTSLIQVSSRGDQKFASLLYYLMRERGIHVWDNRAIVVTTAHREDDLRQLTQVFRDALTEMQASGFIQTSSESSSAARPPAATSMPSVPAAGAGHRQFPLTEAQKEIWLAAQMGGEAAVAYNESLKLEFRGDFDVDLFRRAAHELVQRHPILLARLSANGETQTVPENPSLDVPLVDMSGGDAKHQQEAFAQLLEREAIEPFDLTNGPLARLRIVRRASDHHVAVWTAHHIVCDGWSGGLIVFELARIYSALMQHAAPELDTPIPFHDYATAQAATTETGSAIDYWRRKFAEAPPPLDLPLDHPRPPIRTAKAATARRSIDPAVYQSLKRMAGQQRATMVAVLMAGFKTLLYRLSGQTDLVVGLPVAGQAVTGQTCLVGHCVNLVPIRSRIQPEASFEAHLRAVKQELLDGYEHHQTTIGEILQHVQVARVPDRPSLVEVIFNVDRDPGAAEFHGLQFSCERNAKRALHYDLFLNCVEGTHGLFVECDYNTDLFTAATIDRWLGHLQTLLAAAAANPSLSLASLPIMSDAERHALTIEWNRTSASFPDAETLHGMFEAQVAKTPAAPAVTFKDQQVTYAELNRRANMLAHHLRTLGVARDSIVGLCVERSIEMVVGVLAILKAGAAYLPMDIGYPKDRLSFMLSDTNAPVLLTRRSLRDRLPAHEATVVFMDDALDGPETNPTPMASGSTLAYVIYTSGSTGQPKGVLLEHRNAVNLIASIRQSPGFTEHDVMLSVTTLSFDIATAELFLPLTSGGRLIVVASEDASDGARLLDLVERSGVTFMQPTPVTWQLLLAAGWRGTPRLRMVSTGEPLPPELARRLLPLGAELWNLYGPTETTIWSTGGRVTRLDGPITIGRPIANTQTFILDGNGQPVPVGVVGELFIGGDGVARGYLNRPELTRDRFIPNPLPEYGKDKRLYRTGDLARYRADGSIECLGRIDHQVKLRGFRIELGEIEAVMSRHDGVRQGVVVADGGPGDRRLVAYFEREAGRTVDAEALRAHLRASLPDYMIPSIFVPLDKIPLTANGKIDRRALPSPGEHLSARPAPAPPRDTLEQMLSRLWCKVLKLPSVGIHDNFFELGGHSILAVRVLIEVEKASGTRLPLATLLQAPTIAGLADVLRRQNWQPSWTSLVPIRSGGSGIPLFLMHSHGGNVLEYYPLANVLDEEFPIYALQARGLDGKIAAGQSMQQMAARYIEEMRALQPEGPYFLGGFCFGGLLALEAAQQLTAAGEEVALVVMIQTTHPAVNHFTPETNAFERMKYRLAKRLDLERQNLRNGGKSYFMERARRVWDIMRARVEIGWDALIGRGNRSAANRSLPYILEALSIEHDKVYWQYVPAAYRGKVLLIRAATQLRGLAADSTSLGWKDVFGGGLDVREVEGHQQNMLIAPNVRRVGEILTDHVRAAMTRYAKRNTDAA